jgi:Protein of unknown function (DUF2911)
MKRLLTLSFILVCILLTTNLFAQKKPLSPAATAEGTIDGVKIKINYSAPSSRGRKMIGGNEPYGTVWRTGANESTSFETSAPVKIEGKALPAGKFALFTIPGEKEWTIIFNKTIAMGAYSYNQAEDVLRVNVPAGKPDSFVETFNISIVKNKVVLQWETSKVEFAVSK